MTVDQIIQKLEELEDILKADNYNKLVYRISSTNKPDDASEIYAFIMNELGINLLSKIDVVPTGFISKDVDVNTLVIPENVKRINANAITNNSRISSIIIKGNKELVPECINSLPNLKKLEIEGVKIIPNKCITYCGNLIEVRLDKNVKKLEGSSFYRCAEGIEITTPYRKNQADRLVIPRSSIDWFKQHLKFDHTHDNDVEQPVEETTEEI